MSRLHFELPCGAAGDMIFGALVDCGVDFEHVVSSLRKLELADWDIDISEVVRSGIMAKKIQVIDNSEITHSHAGHTHQHAGSAHSHGAHRHLADMLRILDNPALSGFVKEKAFEVFNLLAEAEAEIHGVSKDEVHFHEVSGIDTLIDVIGSLLALESMGVDYVSAGQVAVGSGTINCAHGVMPVPAPATLKIVQKKSIPIFNGNIETELLTPTGAALLGVLCQTYDKFAGGNVVGVGYGAGDKDFEGVVNAVRAIVYNKDLSTAVVSDRIIEMRFAVDDVTGEELGLLQEKLGAAGVLDSYALPAIMKKSRAGFEVVVLLRSSDRSHIENIIFGSGMTLGMRILEIGRSVLERALEEVKVQGQPIKVKLGMYKGRIVSKKAEFEDCKKAAEITGLEFSEIKRIAESSL